MLRKFKDAVRRYFIGSDSLDGQPLPEVKKALIEDAPRVVRLTIWGIIGFFPVHVAVGRLCQGRRSHAR